MHELRTFFIANLNKRLLIETGFFNRRLFLQRKQKWGRLVYHFKSNVSSYHSESIFDFETKKSIKITYILKKR